MKTMGNTVNPMMMDYVSSMGLPEYLQTYESYIEHVQSDYSVQKADIIAQETKQDLTIKNKVKHAQNVTYPYLEIHADDFNFTPSNAQSLHDNLNSNCRGKYFIVYAEDPERYYRKNFTFEKYGPLEGFDTSSTTNKTCRLRISTSAGNVIESFIYDYLAPWAAENNFGISIQNPNGANNPPDIYLWHTLTGRRVKLDVKAVKVMYTEAGKVSNAMNNTMGCLTNILDCIKVYMETGRITGELATIAIIVKYVTSSDDYLGKIIDIAIRTYPEMVGKGNRGPCKDKISRKHVDKKTGQTQNNNVCMSLNTGITNAEDVDPRLVILHNNEKR